VRIKKLLYAHVVFLLFAATGKASAAQIVASVQFGSGSAALAFTDERTIYLGSFGYDPGEWQAAGSIPSGEALMAVTQSSSVV